MSEIPPPTSFGITAQAASAKTQLTSGASRNTPLLAPEGMIGSFSTNFKRSAKDCSRPHGPTTLGPRRICTAAQILRSASRMYAIAISRTTSSNRLCASMTISGQRKPVQNALAKNSAIRSRSLRCRQHLPGCQTGTFRHHRRGARDRVAQIKIFNGSLEWCFLDAAASAGERLDIIRIAGFDPVDALQVWRSPEQRLPQRAKRIVRQLLAQNVRQGTDDGPILARLSRRKRGAIGDLHPAFGIDVDAGFLGIGRARQDDVGAMGAAVSVGADVDHEGAVRH